MDKRLLEQATHLLDMVASKIRDAGHVVETNPSQLDPELAVARGPKAWLIKIDGEPVPLLMSEHEVRVGGWRSRPSGRLEVRCDWAHDWRLSIKAAIVLKSKTFGYSKNRPDTYGFDVKVIADHLLVWLRHTKNIRKNIELKESLEKDWGAIAERLRERFPDFTSHIDSSATGLKLSLTLNEPQAEAVLAALAGESCRVCGVALLPREKPVCEDCYPRSLDEAW